MFVLEWVFTIVFTVEYILRLLIVRKPLRYATSFFGIIDLLSILPAFIGIIVPGGERLMVVRTMRLLRIFRVFKLARYLSEASALREAFYVSRHKIAVFMTTVLIVVLIGYSLIIVPTGILSAEISGAGGGSVTTRSCASCMAQGHDRDAKYCKRCGQLLDQPDPVPE